MLRGNILDVYPDNKKNEMVTWISSNGKAKKISEKYQPSFFVYSNREQLLLLATALRDVPEAVSYTHLRAHET